MKMSNIYINVFVFLIVIIGGLKETYAQDNIPISTKKERNHISKGNKFYDEGKYKEAMKQYQDALKENPTSMVGKYNLGLTQLLIGSNLNDTSETAKNILTSGIKNMEYVANLGKKRPDLASKANYNLGNVAFKSDDMSKAIDYYKKALRLNPEDDNARRNLRIAQLKQQDQDQNQDQNQQNQQDQQDQNQDQDQQNQQDQQDQNQDQQQEPQSNINEQTAEQILNAMENKENQTRAKVAGQNAEKSRQRNRNKRNW